MTMLPCLDCKVFHGGCMLCDSTAGELAEAGHRQRCRYCKHETTPFKPRMPVAYDWNGEVLHAIVYEINVAKDVLEVFFKDRGSGLCRGKLSDFVRCNLRCEP